MLYFHLELTYVFCCVALFFINYRQHIFFIISFDMKDIRTKIKRQIEIVGSVISSNDILTIDELAFKFSCEALTIKRDMNELRANGIDIHSVSKKGVVIGGTLSNEKILELLKIYFTLSVDGEQFDKATSILAKKLKQKSISIITILNNSIEDSTVIEIEYKKLHSKIISKYRLEPLMIFKNDNNWRLLAMEKGITKQFIVDKIINLKRTNERFIKPAKKTTDEIFETSFKSWLSDDRYFVKLKIEESLASRIKLKQLLDTQKIIENEDGTIIFEAVVNTLGEIASWIVSNGKSITVIEPHELKNIVIRIAQGVLKNYDS